MLRWKYERCLGMSEEMRQKILHNPRLSLHKSPAIIASFKHDDTLVSETNKILMMSEASWG